MIVWIKKFWKWLAGAALGVLAIVSVLVRRRPVEPDPIVPTRKETDDQHKEIEKGKEKRVTTAKNKIDTEVENVLKNFGG